MGILLGMKGAPYLGGPMCKSKMIVPQKQEPALSQPAFVHMYTGWATNSKLLAEAVEGISSNLTKGRVWHRHIVLIGGYAKFARKYPPKLVCAVFQAFMAHIMVLDCE